MNINRYTKIFVKNIMLELGDTHLSLTNHKHVLHAVESAYLAMMPKTLSKGKLPGPGINPIVLTVVLSRLANDFVDYFSKPAPKSQADFDDWCKAAIDKFLTDYNELLTHSGYIKTARYGKAQKILNVTFKYLYLFGDIVSGNPGHFTFCHFAIDRKTLAWYKKNVAPQCSVRNWSDMTDVEYVEIQKNIRTYLAAQSKYPKEPFLAEFEIWSECAFK